MNKKEDVDDIWNQRICAPNDNDETEEDEMTKENHEISEIYERYYYVCRVIKDEFSKLIPESKIENMHKALKHIIDKIESGK